MGRLFGTDGVRGVANRELTAELALALGAAAARRLASSGEPGRHVAVIGRDPRASGEMLEAAVIAGLTSQGVDALRVGVLPTPAVAYLTGAYDAGFGVMISASHNPMPDNGIKVFGPGGHKLDDATEDDIEQLVKGKIAPKYRENFLGYAEIRKVFDITKTGKVAGCMITEGVVKRGCGVRLLRDNVVIHQGELSQLKRFKDDVKEVARGYECGLSFAGFNDLREGDRVECYESELVPA